MLDPRLARVGQRVPTGNVTRQPGVKSSHEMTGQERFKKNRSSPLHRAIEIATKLMATIALGKGLFGGGGGGTTNSPLGGMQTADSGSFGGGGFSFLDQFKSQQPSLSGGSSGSQPADDSLIEMMLELQRQAEERRMEEERQRARGL